MSILVCEAEVILLGTSEGLSIATIELERNNINNSCLRADIVKLLLCVSGDPIAIVSRNLAPPIRLQSSTCTFTSKRFHIGCFLVVQ